MRKPCPSIELRRNWEVQRGARALSSVVTAMARNPASGAKLFPAQKAKRCNICEALQHFALTGCNSDRPEEIVRGVTNGCNSQPQWRLH